MDVEEWILRIVIRMLLDGDVDLMEFLDVFVLPEHRSSGFYPARFVPRLADLSGGRGIDKMIDSRRFWNGGRGGN